MDDSQALKHSEFSIPGGNGLSHGTLRTLKIEFEDHIKALPQQHEHVSPERFLQYREKAQSLMAEADTLFPSEFLQLYYQALLYHYSAEILNAVADHSGDSVVERDIYNEAGDRFHFAGHGFRGLEEYRRAALAYLKSATSHTAAADIAKESGDAMQELESLRKAIRSFRRAKGVWNDVGDYDHAGDAFLKEQKLFQRHEYRTNWLRGAAIRVWGLATGYGESFVSWSMTVLIGIIGFAVVHLLIAKGAPLESLRLSVERSLLIASPDDHPWLQIVQIAYSYFVLGLGVALITRRFSPR